MFTPPIGRTADIYSLGKVLYQACTGNDPRQFPSVPGTLLVSGGQELALLNEIILKACHPEVKHRYRTAGDVRTDLLNAQQRLDKLPKGVMTNSRQ